MEWLYAAGILTLFGAGLPVVGLLAGREVEDEVDQSRRIKDSLLASAISVAHEAVRLAKEQEQFRARDQSARVAPTIEGRQKARPPAEGILWPRRKGLWTRVLR